VVLVNPQAGASRAPAALDEALAVLAAAGWALAVQPTGTSREAEDRASAAAAAGSDVVLAAGGDGTVNAVANGLVGRAAALAVLPLGTANVLAAQLGLVGLPSPLHRPDVVAVAEALAAGRPRRIDCGLARPLFAPARHFVLWAGIGFDAAVAHEMEGSGRALKDRFGSLAYGAVGLRSALAQRGTPARIRLDGERIQERLFLAVAANAPLYGGAVDLLPGARLDDGKLDVALFFGEHLGTAARHLAAVLLRRHGARGHRRRLAAAERLRVLAARPLPVHLDGEPFGTTPLRITVLPGALRLWVPPTAAETLFNGAREA
jgi:YegS/Rv2252/BmrU family lipid kinase